MGYKDEAAFIHIARQRRGPCAPRVPIPVEMLDKKRLVRGREGG